MISIIYLWCPLGAGGLLRSMLNFIKISKYFKYSKGSKFNIIKSSNIKFTFYNYKFYNKNRYIRIFPNTNPILLSKLYQIRFYFNMSIKTVNNNKLVVYDGALRGKMMLTKVKLIMILLKLLFPLKN